MSVETYISGIRASRDKIHDKLVSMGLAQSGDKLASLANTVDGITDNKDVKGEVQEGGTYPIPAGYHNGKGYVRGVGGGGNYELKDPVEITPTKSPQTVDKGDYYGLSGVTVLPIPSEYQSVKDVDALPGEVLSGKIYVTADGTVTAGEMPNNGAVNKTLDTTSGNTSYPIPKGYHSGSGKVQIVLETKTVTPTKSQQKINPTTGKVLSEVVVSAIPAEYITTGDATATTAHILSEKTAYVDGEKVTGTMTDNGAKTSTLNAGGSYTIPAGYHNGSGKVTAKDLASQTTATAEAAEILSGETAWVGGTKITGTMANNGEVSGSIDGLNTNSVTIPAGYTTGGVVSLTDDIENALAAI